MKSVFNKIDSTELINRINQLNSTTKAKWGKMNVAQMLAHCNVTYELVYSDKHPKPNAFKKFILKLIVKNIVVNEKPFKHNSQTGSEFIIKDSKDFETEKTNLIKYIVTTQELGETHFDGKESNSFGPLTITEWNNLFYKHLDHHLTQFGA